MKKILRYLGITLLTVIAFCIIPHINAYAESSDDEGWLYRDYTDEDGNVGIEVCGYAYNETDLVIPDEIGGKKVLAIDMSDGKYDKVKNIKINADDAYFDSSYSLSELDFSNLENIEVNESNKRYKTIEGVLYSRDGDELVFCPYAKKEITILDNVVKIGAYAFDDCIYLDEIKIPDSVVDIDGCAFMGCSSLEEIVIPENVKTIGVSAFNGCTNLKSVILPSGITEIEDGLFLSCENIKTIELPSGITRIGQWAFENCSSLEQIVIPENVKIIDHYAFYGTNLVKIEIPSSVEYIGQLGFAGCERLSEVIIREGVKGIADVAFGDCKNLKELYIPNSVTTFGSLVFLILLMMLGTMLR